MTRLILDPANLPEGMEAFIRETAREEIQQEIQRREKKAKLNRKPLLKKLVEELELDPATEYQVAEAVNMAKDESFRLFKLNRTDGGNFVDDFAGALRSPNRDEEAKRVWVRLLSEKIPGSDETFVARYEQMKAGVNDTIKSLLFEEQWKAYQGLVMDPVQIQTGHTPWQDYFKSQGLEWPEDW